MRNSVSLDDRYDLDRTRIILTGAQAIIRLTLMQKARDKAGGLNTAGYVTGYRGSPVGGLDLQFWRAAGVLKPSDIVFQPGLNEDLAATALWGTQQANLRGDGRFDGVFGIWYGKGPGVDRSGDAFRHANLAGTDRNGGIIALMGDDHTCESSTTAHQSEFAFLDAMMPVLAPAGVQELVDYGLIGFALSRYAGIWVGIKCVKDTIESTAVVDGALDRVDIVIPQDFALPEGGLSIRRGDTPLAQEARLHDWKRPAVKAFVKANGLNRIVWRGGNKPRLGIVTLGKSYLDVRQALADLDIDEARAADLGVALLKLGCSWPLEPTILEEFAAGLEEIVVVEEKRSLVETQVKEILYARKDRPLVVGKTDEEDRVLFPRTAGLDSTMIALGIGRRLMRYSQDERLAHRLGAIELAEGDLSALPENPERRAYFCAGCPHNSSTVVPEGSRAYAGIGCHYMVQWMDRATDGYTQMGGEGANWIGEAPFSKCGHVFQNIGDGTFNHSGVMAIRAAAATGVNITYKILFNDAVAMTGGQPNDGTLTVPKIAATVAAEGARRIVIVSDEPTKYPARTSWPFGTSFHHRSELDAVQRELTTVPGLSILIYDQTCAAEKRRRRKRGTFPDPDLRVFINEAVCEGCGDCGIQSNCVAIQPLDTPLGRKRQIDQSNCNKDFSCLKGFCPAFVSVEGAKVRRRAATATLPAETPLPEPRLPTLAKPWSVVVTGIGGTGVVTIGQVLAMAAHLDGKGVGLIDMAGLAQKGGAVTSHLRIAERPEQISAIRVATGAADLVIGCDLVVTAAKKTLATIARDRTVVLVNDHQTPTADFTRDADATLPGRRLERAIADRAGTAHLTSFDATRLAVKLFGDTIAANMFMLGAAYQAGAVPISESAILDAIELNGVSIAMNQAAFKAGRRIIAEPEAYAALNAPDAAARPLDLDTLTADRTERLTAYHDRSYADRYRNRIAAIRTREALISPGSEDLARAAAETLYKLMAIKDEYEVARLFLDDTFKARLGEAFEATGRIRYHLAPPLLSPRDQNTGRPKKYTFGPWIVPLFRLLKAMKPLRNTAMDPFGYTAERRLELRLLGDYEALLGEIETGLTVANHAAAVALASAHGRIRGFGPVKEKTVAEAETALPALKAAFAQKPDEKRVPGNAA